MDTTIYRAEDPTLETVELGAIYSIHSPRTGDPWTLHKIPDECGVNSIEPLDVSDGWDDAYEYVMGDESIWSRLARLARDADLANADLEVAIFPVLNGRMDANSRALLYRFTWPY